MTLRDLLTRRAAITTEMRGLVDQPTGDGGDMAPEQAARFDSLRAEADGLEQRIARVSALEEAERRSAGQPLGSGDNRFDALLGEVRIGAAIAGAAGLEVDWGREREVSTELARRMGRQPRGVLVPLAALADPRRSEQRTMMANSFGSGGALIGTTVSEAVIDVLRPALLTGRLGATILPDLRGAIDIPRMASGVPTAWIGEGKEIPPGDPNFGAIGLTPRTVAARAEFSRRLLLNSTPAIEQLLRRDLAAGIGQAVDAAALDGSGIGAEPRGLLRMASDGIKSVTVGTVNIANLDTAFASAAASIATANVSDGGLAFAMHPRSAEYLISLRDGNANAAFPSVASGSLRGRPVVRSTLLPVDSGAGRAKAVFGNWPDLLIGMWGVLDLVTNPYGEAFKRGGVEVRAMLDCDVATRHTQSFVVIADAPMAALAT